MKFSPFIIAIFALFFSGCTEMQIATHVYKKATNPAPYSAPAITGKRKIGNPYVITGKRYYPIPSSAGYRAKGIASWYGKDFHNKKTANGETYNMFAMTAAHPTLPLPTYVRVTNLENGLSVMLRVNDRGPFKRGRLIDLSYKAANLLGMVRQGTAPVMVEALPTDGSALRNTRRTSVATTKPKVYAHKKHIPQQTGSFTNRIASKLGLANPRHMEANKNTQHVFENVAVFIQTGAFSDINNAIKQRKKLDSIYVNKYPVQLMKTVRNGVTLHRVRVGPVTTTNEADRLLFNVVKEGFNTAIIVVD